MNNKYAIINIETIQKRIEELESIIKIAEPDFKCVLVAEQVALVQILIQSTPFIPEIEKAFESVRPYVGFNDLEDVMQDYINNLIK